MSIDIGRRVAKHDYGDLFAPYTGVTINLQDGDTSFTAGDDSGRTLTVESPWASQKMADNLLAQVRGARHQPFNATGAILDPAAELGDAITVDGVTGIMYRRSQRFGTLYRSDISAPGDEEINHEIPYYPPVKRALNRVGGIARGAAGAAAKAQGDIIQDRKNLIAALNHEDGAPTDLKAGFDSYVRWDLKNNDGYAASQLFAEIGEKARAEIGVYAVIGEDGKPRTFVEILADQINLESAVEDAFTELELKADSSTVTALDGRVTKTETAQAELTTKVGSVETSLSQKAEQSTVTELDSSLKTLYTGVSNLSTRVGDAETAIEQRVTVKDFDDALAAEQEAITEISSAVDGVSAKLELKADSSTVTGISESVATLQADVIKLQGDTEILGNLSISEGRLRVEKSIITPSTVFANKLSSNDAEMLIGGHRLNIGGDFSADGNGIAFGTKKYMPTPITSTTGTVLVLGIA